MSQYTYETPWISERADPFVIRHTDDWYYFTASLPAFDAIAIRKAKSLAELADVVEHVVWHRHTSGPMSFNIWAPELHYLEGRWYLYFAASNKDDIWHLRPYVLVCDGQDPTIGNWMECGQMQCSDDDEFSFRAFSLDATIFENRGKYYYVWAEKVGVGKQISNLYIAELETPTKLRTVQVLLTSPDYDWERHGFWVNEGPAVLHHKGMIYLTYSASDTSAAYCVGMLSIPENADLLDPRQWHKERYPVLKTDKSKQIYGPGHNSFTVDEEGNDVCVFHARKTDNITGNPLYDGARHAFLMNIRYNENDKPIFLYD